MLDFDVSSFVLGAIGILLIGHFQQLLTYLLFGNGLLQPPKQVQRSIGCCEFEQGSDCCGRNGVPGRLIQGSRGMIHYMLVPPMNDSLLNDTSLLNDGSNHLLSNQQPLLKNSRSVTGLGVEMLPDDITEDLVVILHGFAGSSHVFQSEERSGLMYALACSNRWVLTMDNYGHGHSDGPDTDYSCELFAEQLAELCWMLRIRKPFILIGFSMGGSTAVVFASRHRTMVKKLILHSPSVVEAPLRLSLRVALRIPMFRELLSFVIIPRIGECSKHHGAVRASFRLLLTRIRGGGRWTSQSAGGSTLKMLREGFSHPVFVLWGEKDSVVPFSEAAVLMKVAPYIQLVTHAEADHMCFADGEQMSLKLFFRQTLLDFCDKETV